MENQTKKIDISPIVYLAIMTIVFFGALFI